MIHGAPSFERVCFEDSDTLGAPCEMCAREIAARAYADRKGGARVRLCAGCVALVSDVQLPLAGAVQLVRESIQAVAARALTPLRRPKVLA